MTLATPARVTTAPSHAPAGRASVLLLFPAAVICGLGLGLAALAALDPPPRVAPLPPVTARALDPGTAPVTPEPGRDWAALFGRPPVAAPAPEPLAAPRPAPPPHDPADDFDPDLYVLRGLAVATDDSEGFALLETPDGALVVRRGTILPEGYEVLDITAEGIVIDLFGTDAVIGFPEDRQAAGSGTYDADLRSRAEAPTDRFDFSAPGREGSYDEEAVLDGFDAPPSGRSGMPSFPAPSFPAADPSDRFGRDRFGLSR